MGLSAPRLSVQHVRPLAFRLLQKLSNHAHRYSTAATLRRLPKDPYGDRFADYGWIKLIYSDDGDVQELTYHMHDAEYHQNDLPVYSAMLKPGDAAIDVGANLGWTTVLMASITGPSGRIFSFEPSPRTFRKLLRTIDANGLSGCVTPLNMGCGSSPATLTLNRISGSSGNDTLTHDVSGAQSESVQVVRLDDVTQLRERRIALIKIDTEGYEPFVLDGARELIARDRPLIYLEMGGEYPDSTKESLRILTEMDYRLNLPEGFRWDDVGNGSNFFSYPLVDRGPLGKRLSGRAGQAVPA